MNEMAWLTGSDPTPMLNGVQGRPRRRKLRLFSCACCRRMWALLPRESREGVEAAEQFADGLSSRPELDCAWGKAYAAVLALPRIWSYEAIWLRYATSSAAECGSSDAATTRGALKIASTAADSIALNAAVGGRKCQFDHTRAVTRNAELIAQAGLVRDIFGNPFRRFAVLPEWRTETAVALAKLTYESGEFGALPILADALQDAGCDDEAMLTHCRGPGPHTRGCWVIDSVLGMP
jgi:hypothetical protein